MADQVTWLHMVPYEAQPEVSETLTQSPAQLQPALAGLLVAMLIYLLLLGVALIGSGTKTALGAQALSLLAYADNPGIGLLLGLLATSVVQSSSSVTSIVVGLVGGGLPIATAIPIVFGANIGTTVTNTVVSFGHAGDRKEFSRAFAAASIHDVFNILAVAVFLPIELVFGPLRAISGFLTERLSGLNFWQEGIASPVKLAVQPAVNLISGGLESFGEATAGGLLFAVGVILVVASVASLSKVLKIVMSDRARRVINAALGKNAFSGVMAGTGLTAIVQSSSTTTSLTVPLAAAGTITLRQVLPFVLGANIGTTLTALLAAMSVGGELGQAALQIALIHFLFNAISVTVILSVPGLIDIPIGLAQIIGRYAHRRRFAFAYAATIFFALPGLIVGLWWVLR